VVDILLEKQLETRRVGKGGVVEGWASGTSKETEEGEMGGHICTNSQQCRGVQNITCQKKKKKGLITQLSIT